MTHYSADASRRMLRVYAIVAVFALAAPASAAFNNPTLLFDTPTADVLPAHSLVFSADMTAPLTKTSQNVPYWEADANVRFSPFRHFDFTVVAYTLQDYVLDAKYQLVGGAPGHFGLAVGVRDVGIHNYVSPIGHGLDAAWPDWKYNRANSWYTRPYENFSGFVVTSIPLVSFARLHVGLGRGVFVGYDGGNQFLNTDEFFHKFHQWAVSLFGGMEIFVTPNVALMAEANSRDLNSGVEAHFGPVAATVAWNKMEGLLWAAKGWEFGRLEFGVSYQLDNVGRHVESDIPLYHVAPAPEPGLPPVVARVRLNPIWFNWDKWDILPEAAATLRQNANVLLAHPDMRIVVTGYASEEGTPEHNLPLSERRAYAAYAYLQSLGVPAGQMRFRALGESTGRPLPMHRSVYFEIEK